MDAATLKRVRPAADTAAAIRASLNLVAEERRSAEQRLAECSAARSTLLLDGTAAQIRDADTAIRDAQTDLQQFDAMLPELRRRLADAVAREAGDARAEQVRDAATKIEAFNAWFAENYAKHAAALAEGLELERLAWRAVDILRHPLTRAPVATLPPITLAHVGCDARSLGFLARLPAAVPGQEPFWWPR
jgi:hypothetical protein